MIDFTDDEMTRFLQKRGYRIAQWPCHTNKAEKGVDSEIEMVLIAFKDFNHEDVKAQYWKEDMLKRYGITTIFTSELRKALLRL